jgi:L-alanine-DL-glutamate epimerase-like enolase superfamily enzyme
LHDLAGVILGQPVYELLGSHGPTSMPIYSGMIYFDELEPAEHPGGIDKVLDNCRFDLEHGYRQLKVKIGRGNRWYANDKGLAKDIEIVNTIFDTFKTEGVEILVDANDGYSFADTIAFVEGVDQVPLLWIEEPFREDERQTRRLRDWLHGHDRSKTLVADGEHDVDHDFCMKLARQNTIDVYLNDVMQLGFSRWRQTLAELKRSNTLASPHAWGSMLKTHYAAHLNAGLGGFVTLEGVTCLSDDIDYGDYQIVDGQLSVSRQPGFGMSLAK